MPRPVAHHRQDPEDPEEHVIAIVGAACRLPGRIDTLDALWSALQTGRDLVTQVPPDRFDTRAFVEERRRRPGRSYTAAGAFLEDISGFDAGFFGIAPKEAARVDPQQRLLLELAVEALDDAGMDRADWAGSDTGVFVGISNHDYADLQSSRPARINAYTMTGSAASIAANRLSHAFDWHGESLAVDTACSSSLIALHRACAYLRRGEGPAALAGGVNILAGPFGFQGFAAASMLSPTGRCRAFSAAADGFVRAEGGGVVLLKRLSDALADGDRVHATIVATGTNCDGRTRGLSLPNPRAQEALLRAVYARGGIHPDDLVYFEAHGTGTKAGDPVECEAIGRALGTHRTGELLPIGSVKSNLGHLESASGMVGLFKALLVLRHGTVPPTLHADPLNPDIPFDRWQLRPAVRGLPLPHRRRPVAGVNSFGFGGANAHVVIAAAPRPSSAAAFPTPPPPPAPQAPTRRALPVMVSAHTPAALAESARRMADRLRDASDAEFYDLAHTSCLRRTHHRHRTVVLATRRSDAAAALSAAAGSRRMGASATAEAVRDGRTAFVFSGNGSQWAGMGTALLAEEPAFRAAVQRIDTALSPHLGWSVHDALDAAVPAYDLRRTEVAQPLLFAVQTGLVALLAEEGVRPAAVAGHSVGEIAAACAAGVLDPATAARVVAARSLAQATTAGQGRMAAVGLSADAARAETARYEGRIALAGINSERDVTLAGPADDLADLGERLTRRQVFFRLLDLDYAFHSPSMDAVRGPLCAELAHLRPAAGRIPFYSAVTGAVLPGEKLDGEYWWDNVRLPVLFADTARALRDDGYEVFLEIGPHPVVAPYLRRMGPPEDSRAVIRTCTRDGDGPREVRQAVAHLLAVGAAVDRTAHFPLPASVATLPAYPWQRERHWNGDPTWWTGTGAEAGARPDHPLLGARLAALEPLWSGPLEPSRMPWLGDHKVGDAVVMPATAYLEAAFAAATETFDGPVEVLNLHITRPLTLPWDDDTADPCLQVSLSDEDHLLRVAARQGPDADWQLHARGRVRRLLLPTPQRVNVPTSLAPAGAVPMDGAEHYARIARAGLPYGPAFRVLTGLTVSETEVLASYALDLPIAGFRAHPAILDGALQAGAPLLAAADPTTPFLPTEIARARLWQSPPATGWIYVQSRGTGATEACWDVTLLDDRGQTTAQLQGCRLRRLPTAAREPALRWETVLRPMAHPSLPHPAPHAPLPAPRELAEIAVPRRTARGSTDRRDKAAEQWLQQLTAHFTAAAVHQLLDGTEADTTVGFSTHDLITAGMAAKHTRLMNVLLPLAAERGLLSRAPREGTAPRWTFATTPRPESLLAEGLRSFPEHGVTATLFGRCGLHLAEVLRGECDARELLFAGADRHLIEQVYSRCPFMDTQLRTMGELLRAAAAAWPVGRPLRILEVGAGTGGLTERLLPLLPPERTEYVFSDVSSAFFPHARRRFDDYDVLSCRTYDLDRPLHEQDLPPGSFDVILAHSALHVAKDLKKAVTGLAGLLAEGGQLMAVEPHDPRSLALCFGLLDEFWSFTDTGLRSSSPLLTAPQWEDLLTSCGFAGTHTITAGSAGDTSSISVILAQRTAGAPGKEQRAARAPGADTGWIIAAERPEGALARELTAHLTASGARNVHRVALSDSTEQWTAATDIPAGTLHTVLLLDDEPPSSEAEAVTELAVHRIGCLAAFARAYAARTTPTVSTLSLVTRSAAALTSPAVTDAPGDAAPWAAARCLANEHASLTVRRIALDEEATSQDVIRRLALELLEPTQDDEVQLTAAGRFVARSRPLENRCTTTVPCDRYRLDVRDPGPHHRLVWVRAEAPEMGPDDVLVEVRAVGLNYRDALEARALVRPTARAVTPTGQALGLECAGVVSAVGPQVTGLLPGDRVFALAPRAMASHVVAPSSLVGRIPDDMSFAEAATLPVAVLTVHHALGHLGRMTEGETLLVHSAAGGVGLAALDFARSRGIEVIATAGTPAKRDLLRLLGIAHVLDSRTLDFSDGVREATGGRGVDVVLNSLAGEALTRSVELLAPGGRFIELGKRDIAADSRLGLSLLQGNRSLCTMDLDELAHARKLSPDLLASTFAGIRSGAVRPLPYQSYPADRAADALGLLQHSRHTGKVVVTLDEPPPVRVPPAPLVPDPEATYLVTGGLSGLGAATALHLADRGARHLVLVGRRGPATPGAPSLTQSLAARGAHATVHAADLGDRQAVEKLLKAVASSGRPLRGIVHAAMVLHDAPLAELTGEQIRTALRPKMLGALLLDASCREPLDFFLAYSSVTATLGNHRQANYAAANLFLEALARTRRARGRHALALALGAVSDTGYVARAAITATLGRAGLGALSSAEVCEAADDLLAADATVALLSRIDWTRNRLYLPATGVPRFEGVTPVPARRPDTGPEELRRRLAAASPDEARDIVAGELGRAVADVLQTDPDHIDRQQPLDRLGMDSLMAAELVGVVARRLGCEIPAVELINSGSINGLAARALHRLGHGAPTGH
ncbi:SDR family NAD(P)-dependent oxidoreductase [Streptomyces syringium]|uniref:SDR family NAD(P)-dependent oxidoreductase n=1 Tax=Streptomyces syringium TaxID=76729 RepID=UPI0036E4DB7A